MKSRISYALLAFMAATLCFQSCVIEEHYHFSKEKSGHYSMSFDLGKFAEKDSTGAMMKGVIDGMTEELSKVEVLQGITDMTSTVDGNIVSVSYDFKDIETLNVVENIDEEGKERDFFSYKKGVLSLNPNMESLKKNARGKDKGEDMTELMATMLVYKITVTFDEDMDVKKLEGFEQVDAKTYVFDSTIKGWDVSPSLKLKDK
jgi:hypothetical protein